MKTIRHEGEDGVFFTNHEFEELKDLNTRNSQMIMDLQTIIIKQNKLLNLHNISSVLLEESL